MNKSKDFLHSSSCIYHDKSPVFTFTNENLAAYVSPNVRLGGKNVLTVAASGDQAFEALSAGASCVDTFDINSSQRLILELKTKMIRGIGYDNFMDFFFSSRNRFNPTILKPVMAGFSSRLQTFLLACYTNLRIMQAYSADCQYWVSYMADKGAYDALRDALPENISFVHTDIKGLSVNIAKKYDLIMLSNICESMYPQEGNALNVYKQFYHEVLAPLTTKNLNPGGRICFDYLFAMPNISDDYFESYWLSALRAVKRSLGAACPHKFSLGRVPSASTPGRSDLVMIMQRVR
ncbi:MAG: DUF3419 family protein [Alphaproteobacteria bacterium]|nr:DUF3419 family protein [Alphaproteobacteria bacterium]